MGGGGGVRKLYKTRVTSLMNHPLHVCISNLNLDSKNKDHTVLEKLLVSIFLSHLYSIVNASYLQKNIYLIN